MPKRSVWEMTHFERLHYSLGGRTFRLIVLMMSVLSLIAVTIGFYLYSTAVDREFRTRTWRMAKTGAEVIDIEEVRREAEIVASVYAGMTESERRQQDDPAYRSQFEAVYEGGFREICDLMYRIEVDNEGIASYTAMLDLETNRMIFLADSDPEATVCPPGTWDEMQPSEIRGFVDGAEPHLLDELYGVGRMPSVPYKTEKYGYRCTAGKLLFWQGEYPVFLFFDTDMNQVAEVSKSFLLQYLLVLLLVTVGIVALAVSRIKKTVVRPVNALAEASARYRTEGVGSSSFQELDIHTGDEIENLSLTMQAMERDLETQVKNLTHITAEKERIGTELALATRIQADMLPNIYPAFPEREEFDIYASMRPAKEVGGDFYDFFLIDDDHLALVIADVSGKGVPAALFMMISKILVQNYALTGRSPGKVLEAVNRQICQNNREEMFVTVWLGVLELTTGKLTAANAGHEYPILKQPTGKFELVRDKHGFVVGGLETARYTEYELQMDPDAKLFLHTDGLTEANDASSTLFGTDRVLAALRQVEEDGPQDIIRGVTAAVDRFVGEAPQFDDLTMLCLHYVGRGYPAQSGKELTVDATVENIAVVTEFVAAELENHECPAKMQMQVDLAIDELLSNIAYYAYAPEVGPVTVHIRFEEEPRAVWLTFIDRGRPFDPLSAAEPDITLPAEERVPGGLGVFLVKKIMDEVSYDHQAGQNIFRIKKRY